MVSYRYKDPSCGIAAALAGVLFIAALGALVLVAKLPAPDVCLPPIITYCNRCE